MADTWDVLGIGCVAVDELIYVDQYPVADSKLPVSEVRRQGGGNTATALVAAARQGASAAYCAGLGADELSAFSMRELEGEGVDCSLCASTTAGRPFHSFVIVEHAAHTRTILYEIGQLALPPDAVTRAVEQCRVLLIDHFAGEAATLAVSIARRRGIPVVADVENETGLGAEVLLAEASHLIIGRALAARLTGLVDVPEMLGVLGRPNQVCCAITAGEEGCWYSERGGPAQHRAAWPVDVVDSTGCGDVFHGVYAAATARGESVARSVEMANAAAALKATRSGGRAGIPRLADVEKFLAQSRQGGAAGSRG